MVGKDTLTEIACRIGGEDLEFNFIKV